MFLTKLAVKNLIRHKNRTVITASIIAFAIFFYLIMDSMIAGMTQYSFQSIIDFEAGHIQIAEKAYWDDMNKLPLENLLKENEDIEAKLAEIKGFKAASPELSFQAMLNNGVNEIPVMGKGVIPDEYLKVIKLDSNSVSGRMFLKGEQAALVGKKMAELMNLQIGDYITLLVRDKNNTFNTIDVEICGLINCINANLNRNVVLIPLDVAQSALGAEGEVSKILVTIDKKGDAEKSAKAFEERVKSEYPGIGAYPWNKLDAVSIAGAKNAGNSLIVSIILMIAAIAIINTVILAALERMEEIGVMKAMGLQEKEIIYTFVIESTGIGILGGIAGLLLGIIGVWMFTRFGIDWGAMAHMDMASFGIPVEGKIRGVWVPYSFIKIFVFSVVVSFLSSILPSNWAASKDPVKSIYHK